LNRENFTFSTKVNSGRFYEQQVSGEVNLTSFDLIKKLYMYLDSLKFSFSSFSSLFYIFSCVVLFNENNDCFVDE